jgi:hypothetical protein
MVLWKPGFPDRNAAPTGEGMNKLEETAERLFGEALDLPREQRPGKRAYWRSSITPTSPPSMT